MIAARRLNSESLLKVVSPASALREESDYAKGFAKGYRILESHFKLENTQHWEGNHQGFAATDELRAAELNDSFRNRKIDGMIASRGGYGSLRIINSIDYEMVKQNPKPLIGFSDITALQLAMYQKSGLVGFSGPAVATITQENSKFLLPLLCENSEGFDLIPAANKEKIEVINPGKGEGVLLGGNLFTMVQIIGTGFLPRLDNAILFIEDVNETVNHIDSFLNHLKLAGLLYKIVGMVIGDINWRKESALTTTAKYDTLFRQRIAVICRKEIPVIIGVDYGHIKNSITIPIGVKALLDTSTMSLTLQESATNDS